MKKTGKDINDPTFLMDENIIKMIDEDAILELLKVISSQASQLIEEKQLNTVRVFQRKELVENIKKNL